MMVTSTQVVENVEGDDYSDSELGEEEEYSDEVGDEFGSDEVYVPKTFEDFQTLFQQQFEPVVDDEDRDYEVEEELVDEKKIVASSSEPQSVDREMEARVEKELLKMPEKAVATESPEPELSPDEGPLSVEDEYEHDADEEPDELSGRLRWKR